MSNYINYKGWYKITYPFTNISVEVWGWTSNSWDAEIKLNGLGLLPVTVLTIQHGYLHSTTSIISLWSNDEECLNIFTYHKTIRYLKRQWIIWSTTKYVVHVIMLLLMSKWCCIKYKGSCIKRFTKICWCNQNKTYLNIWCMDHQLCSTLARD